MVDTTDLMDDKKQVKKQKKMKKKRVSLDQARYFKWRYDFVGTALLLSSMKTDFQQIWPHWGLHDQNTGQLQSIHK